MILSPLSPSVPMDVQLPVYLFDVTTAAEPPRIVVTCRTAEAAQALAVQLNGMAEQRQLDGSDTYTAAPPRVALVTMTVQPGSSVTVEGFQIASDVLAEQLTPAVPVVAAVVAP